MPGALPELLANAMRKPSGDHAGSQSPAAARASVRGRQPPPSTTCSSDLCAAGSLMIRASRLPSRLHATSPKPPVRSERRVASLPSAFASQSAYGLTTAPVPPTPYSTRTEKVSRTPDAAPPERAASAVSATRVQPAAATATRPTRHHPCSATNRSEAAGGLTSQAIGAGILKPHLHGGTRRPLSIERLHR